MSTAPPPAKVRCFLTAEWRHLLMLNYVVDPALLTPHLPPGLELDFHAGETFVSVVGFLFLRTRVLGVAIPGHRNFEEVNLRFYVRRRTPESWRRGVVFISEMVPRRAIAWVARAVYGEPYTARPMGHVLRPRAGGLEVRYWWRREGRQEEISACAPGAPREMEAGSPEEFIAEHYWGYSRHGASGREYRVEHPRWRVWPVQAPRLEADTGTLYGRSFAATLAAAPASAALYEGSAVQVHRHRPAA